MPSQPSQTPGSSIDKPSSGGWFKDSLRRLPLWGSLYLLVLPTVLSLAVFSYYPKLDVVRMSLYRWNPPSVLEFIGLQNFVDAFSDQLFWQSFQLIFILFVANLVKLWPGIIAAIALHRLRSNRCRYIYQVCFVVPMIVPGMVWLLIWKSFYEPDTGLFNNFLNFTGLMGMLDWMDQAMPALANGLSPLFNGFIDPVFGGVGAVVYLGFLLGAISAWKDHGSNRRPAFILILALSIVPLLGVYTALGSNLIGGCILAAIAVALMIGLARALGDRWIAWPFLLLAGTVVLWGELWRLPLFIVLAFAVYAYLYDKENWILKSSRLFYVGLGFIAVGSTLVLFGTIWVEPTLQFASGTPAWLGSQDLAIPALILWGFPWVGTVSVLIYLSGLQNISDDVYEAAELDGVSPLGMIWHIELPLIMTQVRINLIFMTIGTLTGYEMFLILLGPDGGPGNVGMVPGLYMFSSAFSDGKFGYACALGMVLFIVILTLTIVYQKYVKVDK